jgi:hypothetical protein
VPARRRVRDLALNLKRLLPIPDLRKVLAIKGFGARPQIHEGYAASLRTPFSLKLLQISGTFNRRIKVKPRAAQAARATVRALAHATGVNC